MKKKIGLLMLSAFIIVTMIMSMSVSGQITEQMDFDENSRIVTDMEGETVTVTGNIDSYAIAWAGLTDIVAMFDNLENCVAFPEKSTKYELLFSFCPNLEGKLQLPDKGISAEALIDLNVQVVFLKASDDEELVQKLKQCDVAVINCEFKDYEGLKQVVEIIADTFGTEVAEQIAEKYCAYIDEQVESAAQVADSIPEEERCSAIVIRDTVDYSAFGQTRYTGKWVELCGADYAMKNEDSYANVNLTKEQLFEYDPDVIFFSMPGEAEKFLSDDLWSGLKAVQNGHVYNVPNGLNTWSNSGSESALIFAWAQSLMYPELVNYDIDQVVKTYYKEFYNYTLNDTEVATILFP